MVAPSILAADFGNLERDITLINKSEADLIHFDVMDGVFVPNISFGLPICEAVKKVALKPLDVHLMIVNPEKYIDAFKKVGANYLTVHIEACPHLHRVIQMIKEAGCKAGVALNPHTEVQQLRYVIQDLDLVLIMSVNPGYGGQRFIPGALDKVAELRQMIDSTGSHALIEVDGGVNLDTGAELVRKGADILVAGSFVFNSSEPANLIHQLKNLQG
jgi:ribulose-phosphate 3-epimerase